MNLLILFLNAGTNQLWHVPVSVITSNNTSDPAASTLLEKDSCTLLVSGVQADQWVKVMSPLKLFIFTGILKTCVGCWGRGEVSLP